MLVIAFLCTWLMFWLGVSVFFRSLALSLPLPFLYPENANPSTWQKNMQLKLQHQSNWQWGFCAKIYKQCIDLQRFADECPFLIRSNRMNVLWCWRVFWNENAWPLNVSIKRFSMQSVVVLLLFYFVYLSLFAFTQCVKKNEVKIQYKWNFT